MGKRNCFALGGIALVLSLILGCAGLSKYGKLEKSARQQYQRGNYDKAVSECAASLKIKPAYDKAQMLMKDAFRIAVGAHEAKIKELTASSAKFRWDDVAGEYDALISINQEVKGLPTLVDKRTKQEIKFEIADYAQALAEAKTNAAETHYQEGLRLSQSEGVDIQKQAAKEFKAAESFMPGYKDAGDRYEQSRKSGIKRIAIIPFEDKTGKGGKYGAVSETILDEIVSDVMNDPSAMEFLEIITRDQLEQVMREQQLGLTGIIDDQTAVAVGKVLGVHEILSGKITQIMHTPERTIDETYTETANVVVRTEKYVDDKGKTKERDVRGDVSAKVTRYTRTTDAKINGSYRFIEVKTAKLKKSEAFTGQADFKAQWAVFAGDKRALSKATLSLGSEQPAPAEDEMVERARRNLSASLANTLKAYAR